MRCLPPLAGVLLVLLATPSSSALLPDALRARLRSHGTVAVQGHALAEARRVEALYRARGFAPLWVEQGLTQRGRDLLAAIAAAKGEGLDPSDYRASALRALARRAERAEGELRERMLQDLELLLSDAFVRYASDRASGRVEPGRLDPEVHVRPRALDVTRLARALEAHDVHRVLSDLDPPRAGFRTLRRALRRVLEIADAGGWGEIPACPLVRPGGRHACVGALRQRLSFEPGLDPPPPTSDPTRLDAALAEALRVFQRRHGLEPDGVLGPRSRAAANVPARARARQIALVLERWRWLPHTLGTRHVLVNTAAAELALVERGDVRLRMRVVVGCPVRRTPVFSAEITHVVLNPVWTVPASIASGDLREKAAADPGFLRRGGFEVFAVTDSGERPVDPEAVDWSGLEPESFAYRLRQLPGPANALGAIKFVLPNSYGIFLHDTPDRALFAAATRTASAGCVRLERALALAEALFGGDPRFAEAREAARRTLSEEVEVPLPEPVPVHLQYRTVWVDEERGLQFRPDVYGRDARLARALAERSAGA